MISKDKNISACGINSGSMDILIMQTADIIRGRMLLHYVTGMDQEGIREKTDYKNAIIYCSRLSV